MINTGITTENNNTQNSTNSLENAGWISDNTYAIKVNGKYYSITVDAKTLKSEIGTKKYIMEWAKNKGVTISSNDI